MRQASGRSWTRPYPRAQPPVPVDAWRGDWALLRPAVHTLSYRKLPASQCQPFSIVPTSFALILPQHQWGGGGCPLEASCKPVPGTQGQEPAIALQGTGSLGTRSWRWTGIGIPGPDFGPRVQLACLRGHGPQNQSKG